LGIAAAPLTIAILSRERGLIYLFFAVDGVRKLCKCRINDGKRIRHKDFVVLNSKVYLKSTLRSSVRLFSSLPFPARLFPVALGSYTITLKGLTSDNYDISFAAGTLTVEKADPVVTVPTAKENLTYIGSAQELVTSGSVAGGTMYYAVTTTNIAPAESLYTTSIPTANDAGT